MNPRIFPGLSLERASASGSGGGSVTSVAVALDTELDALLTVTGSPVTTSGTFAFALDTQSANRVFASPNGTSGKPAFRALVAADIPPLASSDGVLVQTVSGFVGRSLAAGSGISITNADGVAGNPSIAIDSTVVTLTGAQTLTNKTLTTPTIGDFSNATHNHENAAGGGTLNAAAIASGVLANARVNWEAPGTIGSTTPNTGDFTTLRATGQLLASNGTVSAPSLSFDSNSDMGFYRVGTNVMGFASNGFTRTALGNGFRIARGAINATTVPINATGEFMIGQPSSTMINEVLRLTRIVTGAAGSDGRGGSLMMAAETTTSGDTDGQPVAALNFAWFSATHASRLGEAWLGVYDVGTEREALRVRAASGAAQIGFLGATPVSRPTVSGSRGGNAALASLLTALANLGLITDSTTA